MNKFTIQVISYQCERCKYCGELIHERDDADITHAVNHYVNKHGMDLLHTGQSSYEQKGRVLHGTTAMLGGTPPPKRDD